jgi:AcrR family transcriptional regulator
MQDVFLEVGLSAGAVYSHFGGKHEIIDAIADEVIETIASALGSGLAAGQPPPLGDVLDHVLDALEQADVATIAVTVWGEAVRDPQLRRRLAARYRAMHEGLTGLVLAHQRRGALDPDVPADEIAQVLVALGPAFLHQRALEGGADAAAFGRGLRALLRTT